MPSKPAAHQGRAAGRHLRPHPLRGLQPAAAAMGRRRGPASRSSPVERLLPPQHLERPEFPTPSSPATTLPQGWRCRHHRLAVRSKNNNSRRRFPPAKPSCGVSDGAHSPTPCECRDGIAGLAAPAIGLSGCDRTSAATSTSWPSGRCVPLLTSHRADHFGTLGQGRIPGARRPPPDVPAASRHHPVACQRCSGEPICPAPKSVIGVRGG